MPGLFIRKIQATTSESAPKELPHFPPQFYIIHLQFLYKSCCVVTSFSCHLSEAKNPPFMWFMYVSRLCWHFPIILFSPELKVLSAAVLGIPPLNLYLVPVWRLFSQNCACMGRVLKSSTGEQQPRLCISTVLLHEVQSFRGLQDVLLGEKSLKGCSGYTSRCNGRFLSPS